MYIQYIAKSRGLREPSHTSQSQDCTHCTLMRVKSPSSGLGVPGREMGIRPSTPAKHTKSSTQSYAFRDVISIPTTISQLKINIKVKMAK